MELYYLPVYSSKGEEEYTFFTGDYEADKGFRHSFNKIFAGYDEMLLTTIKSKEEVNIHYADSLDDVDVRDAFDTIMEADRKHHKKLLYFDAACWLAHRVLFIPLIGFPQIYRMYRHGLTMYKSYKTQQKATYEDDPLLSELENIIFPSTSKQEAYEEAAQYASEHSLDQVAEFYKHELNVSFGEKCASLFHKNHIKTLELKENEDNNCSKGEA